MIPQRYEFSSKSQLTDIQLDDTYCCCWYHKGTNFQANHNQSFNLISLSKLLLIPQRYEFSSKSQLTLNVLTIILGCCWYHKGTNFQANHNISHQMVATDKLLLIPQRYEFSSKSQHFWLDVSFSFCCCWYHKGTNFQANHNFKDVIKFGLPVVVDTTKVRIFKQITTQLWEQATHRKLLLIPQRYEFSSKSQLMMILKLPLLGCCWYHKGTNFQANHNNYW